MNLILEEIDPKCLVYYQPVCNTVMDESEFMRVGYSTSLFAMNGVYTTIQLNGEVSDSFFNKSRISYQLDSDNQKQIDKIVKLEKDILSRAGISGREEMTKLKEQLLSKSIRVFNNDPEITTPISSENTEIVVKISGVWMTDRAYGLTFKFFQINHQLKSK
jgi:hypothetical protein